MKLKKWKAYGSDYSHGRFEYFWRKKSALKWIEDNSHWDILSITNRWTGETEYIKDRLFGRTGAPKATIIMETDPNGFCHTQVTYNDKEVADADL